MFEKVNPSHPDKIADRISGALVDIAYARSKQNNPRIAVECLIGHNKCLLIIETSENISQQDCEKVVHRIAGNEIEVNAIIVPQDPKLAANQAEGLRAGDNGIFKGVPPTEEQNLLTCIAGVIYKSFPYDGKYLIEEYKNEGHLFRNLTICQSHVKCDKEHEFYHNSIDRWLKLYNSSEYDIRYRTNINPLGEWTGGLDADCGATNRKLGSDMGDAVTGGGLCGKDLSKADVSVNIMCHLKAVDSRQTVTAICSIGDETVTFHYADGNIDTMTFAEIVKQAKQYIDTLGGFEKLAEWGLIRP